MTWYEPRTLQLPPLGTAFDNTVGGDRHPANQSPHNRAHRHSSSSSQSAVLRTIRSNSLDSFIQRCLPADADAVVVASLPKLASIHISFSLFCFITLTSHLTTPPVLRALCNLPPTPSPRVHYYKAHCYDTVYTTVRAMQKSKYPTNKNPPGPIVPFPNLETHTAYATAAKQTCIAPLRFFFSFRFPPSVSLDFSPPKPIPPFLARPGIACRAVCMDDFHRTASCTLRCPATAEEGLINFQQDNGNIHSTSITTTHTRYGIYLPYTYESLQHMF